MKLLSSPFIKKATRVLGAFAFLIFWIAIVSFGLKYFIEAGFFGGPSFTFWGEVFFACIFAPLWEELAFRHAPLQIAKKLKKGLGVNFTWPIVIISSTLFGWGHGLGPISLLMQGCTGLVLSYVYLKNNYSYWSSVVVHCLWNTSLMFVFPAFASTYGFHNIFHF